MTNNKTEFTAKPEKQGTTIVRQFEAPRKLVFKTFTDLQLYVQWLGQGRLKMTLERFDPASGGGSPYRAVNPPNVLTNCCALKYANRLPADQ